MLVGGTNKKHVVKYEVPVTAPDETLAVSPSPLSCHSRRWMPEHAAVEERVADWLELQMMESKVWCILCCTFSERWIYKTGLKVNVRVCIDSDLCADAERATHAGATA